MPSIDELLLNPVVAAAAVTVITNVITSALISTGDTKEVPTWLAVVVSLTYMLVGYIVSGRTAPDELFLAVVYAFLAVATLAHVDGAILNKVFGRYGLRTSSGRISEMFPRWL
jgi:fucose permease